jgi:MoaA/NifB/PqqE/SkfB family radical SAM enzyme
MQSSVGMRGRAAEVERRCADDGTISHLPILLLNVHERCNCRCLMCDIWKRKESAELDLEKLANQRESFRRLGVKNVVLTGGEPLLHSRLEDLCRLLRSCDVQVTLLTTGLLLTKLAPIVAREMDEVIVSLDGPEEVHDQVRRVKGAFRLVYEGVREVRRINPAMQFHGRSTVQKANHSVLRRTVAAAKALQFDSISFLALDATSQAFNRELVWPGERQSEVVLTRTQVDALDDEIDALLRENAEDLRSRFIRESEEKFRRIARRFREHLGELEPIAPQCNAPWVSAVLEVDGGVRPCFFHPRIGTTHDNSLEEVINGADARSFRKSLKVDEDPICRRCVCSLNYRHDSTSETAFAISTKIPDGSFRN